ncbi:hypothetical protein Q3G72_021156 [Acer saccharum]|nr:hypothetical protein Q3G72_021156 [Acer saccharum]
MLEYLHSEQPEEEEEDKKITSLENNPETQLNFFERLKHSFDNSDEVDDKNPRNVPMNPKEEEKDTKTITEEKLKDSVYNGDNPQEDKKTVNHDSDSKRKGKKLKVVVRRLRWRYTKTWAEIGSNLSYLNPVGRRVFLLLTEKVVKKKNGKLALRWKLNEKMPVYLHSKQPEDVEDNKIAAMEEENGDEPQEEEEALFDEEEEWSDGDKEEALVDEEEEDTRSNITTCS